MKPISELVKMAELMPHTPWENPKTVIRKIKGDKFPFYRIGRDYMFDLKEVELWFKRRMITQKAS